MAAYRRVYDFGHLRADCRGPRSAMESYARSQYGTAFSWLARNVATLRCPSTTWFGRESTWQKLSNLCVGLLSQIRSSVSKGVSMHNGQNKQMHGFCAFTIENFIHG